MHWVAWFPSSFGFAMTQRQNTHTHTHTHTHIYIYSAVYAFCVWVYCCRLSFRLLFSFRRESICCYKVHLCLQF